MERMRTEDVITKLRQFTAQDKFGERAWNARGIEGIELGLSNEFSSILNSCTEELITAVADRTSVDGIKIILKNALGKFKKIELDTESKELISEYFFDLATITNVDFADEISRWLYNVPVAELRAPLDIVIDTFEEQCCVCKTSLRTKIIKEGQNIPASWFIVKCTSCQEYNILSVRANIKELRFENYTFIEQFRTDQYKFNEVAIRLEEIKAMKL